MPLPLAPLLTVIASALAAFFSNAFAKLLGVLTQKAVFFGAFLVAAFAFTSTMTDLVLGALDSIPEVSLSTGPLAPYAQFIGGFFPDITLSCIQACLSAELAAIAARWVLRLAMVKAT